jgi:hypothetical protein
MSDANGRWATIEIIEPTEKYGLAYYKVPASFQGLVEAVKALSRNYPEDISFLCSEDSPDAGTRFTWHVNQALKQLKGTHYA